MDAILQPLTAAQREAVTYVEGPLLVLAGPGSGKTRVVTHRIAYLLQQGVYPSQIVALTFTNKAADEMARRVEQLVPGCRVWISTFHRFCARILREHARLVGLEPNFSIYDTDASLSVIKQALDAVDSTSKYVTAEGIANRISWAKARLLTPKEWEQCAQDPVSRAAAKVYPLYQQLLLNANAVDFDDLLQHVAMLLRQYPDLRAALDARYRFLLVDEYQDTNLAQYAILRGLSVDFPNVSVTGDPDQSIYSWRGADISNILRFEEDYPQAKIVRLEENFRSTQRIVAVAAHLIAHNRRRKPKDMFTHNPLGQPVRLVRYAGGSEEADDIAQQIANMIAQGKRPGDFAVFYRTNALSRSMEQAMRRAGIPYQVVRGLEFYQRREIKDLLAYLYLLNNPRDDAAFRRIVNVPPRRIGKQTLRKLGEFALQHRKCLLDAAQDDRFLSQFSRRAADSLVRFTDLYATWRHMVDRPVAEILQRIIDDVGYKEYVDTLAHDADVDRQANIAELIGEASEFDAARPTGPWLEPFLERVSLVNDTDTWDAQGSKVSLMTLHAAKGLEFPVVFIIGVEDGLLPHARCSQDADALEEERRLLFVGITRAQEQLQLSFADYRAGYDNERQRQRIPSSFLHELPLPSMDQVGQRFAGTHDDDRYSEDVADEHGWGEDEPSWQVEEMRTTRAAQVGHRHRRRRKGRSTATTLRTASMMASPEEASEASAGTSSSPSSIDPDQFQLGDVVIHPEYGLGRIVRASGEGRRRVVAVEFFNQPERAISFCLCYSPLVLLTAKKSS